ncbi:hypothetical protein FT643_12975 [Ketobacter sp. MCCC 1A13808]|uniref:hypothetical protein n=1 Tax=Ketobacter sp. MCCC 1A13808 TaxID=2602738 RepID=UPI000F1DD85C|nr:hypothetical protein [Ketobacter sp. MCCC 1A13808]MVF13050.1 hypothetical protein [Ketobacter sp. MCCC 1A13808]RLP53038.1 MAG: hypothetical protein D6160_18105 [Ketobacter sp.]
MTLYFCLLFCAFLVQAEPEPSPQENVILANASSVSEGFVTLSFEEYSKQEQPVRIQISSDSQFQHLVREFTLTSQSQVHLSGFNDGDYFARIVSPIGQPVGKPAQFAVAHRDLTSATLLFGLGAALFAILVVCLFRFTQKNN